MVKKLFPKITIRIMEEHRGTIARSRGLKSGFGVTTVMCYLFEINEKRPFESKLTNSVIQNSLFNEFPSRKTLQHSIKTGKSSVNSMRHKYNQGILNSKIPVPPLISLRYGEDGYPVTGRRGQYYMTKNEIIEACYKYRIKDPRVFFDDGTPKDVIEIRLYEEDHKDGESEDEAFCGD